jgi:hypothetical protein
MDNKKLAMILGSVVLVVGIGTLLYIRKQNKEAGLLEKEEKPLSNLDQVVANMGSGAVKVNDIVTATFNSKNNFVNFYSNDRLIIFDAKTKKRIASGSFSDGGKTIIMDNQKVFASPTVWGNLANAIK